MIMRRIGGLYLLFVVCGISAVSDDWDSQYESDVSIKEFEEVNQLSELSAGEIDNWFIEYEGKFLVGKLKPFDDLNNLKPFKNDVPHDLREIALEEPTLEIHFEEKKQSIMVSGKMTYQNDWPLWVRIFGVRDTDVGKTGVALAASLLKGEKGKSPLTLGDLTERFIPGPARPVYNLLGSKLKKVWNDFPARRLGFVVTTIPAALHFSTTEGILPYKTDDSTEYDLNAGVALTGVADLTTAEFPTPDMDPKTFRPKIGKDGRPEIGGMAKLSGEATKYFTFVPPEGMFVAAMGLSPEAWYLSIMLGKARFKFKLSEAFTLQPGGAFLEVSLEPSIAAGASMLVDMDGDNLDFSAQFQLTTDPLNPTNASLVAAATMRGMWQAPPIKPGQWPAPKGYKKTTSVQDAFGLPTFSIANVGGQIAFSIAGKEAEQGAGEAGEGVEDTFTAGATAGEGTTAGAAAPAPVDGVGFTWHYTVGERSNPLYLSGDMAVNVENEQSLASAMNFLAYARYWGTLSTKDLSLMLASMDKGALFFKRQAEWIKSLFKGAKPKKTQAPAPPLKPKNPSQKYGPYLPKKSVAGDSPVDQKKRHEDFKANVGSQMFNTPMPIGKHPVSIQKVIKALDGFAANFHKHYKITEKWFADVPEFGIKNLEYRIAPSDVEVGNLWFDQGFTLRGSLLVFGKEFGFVGTISTNGIILKAFMPTIDMAVLLAEIPEFKSIASRYKGQVELTGAGPDGVYGKPGSQAAKDNGPAFNLQLNFSNLPSFVLTGKLIIKPMVNLEISGDVRINLKEGIRVEGTGELGGYGVSYASRTELTDGKPNLVETVKLKQTKLLAKSISTAMTTHAFGASVKALKAQEKALKKKIAQKKAALGLA